ncbi:hypothetical protein AB0C76_21895 [Kitasatospora sp. NPDC048722]|uniref:hypothetical protein n=1 Tax=Kitasatospora sp. NPDC048722 TaxID=3155639 RepID=UPI0033DF89A0
MEQERMPRGRRAVALAGLVLAAAVTVAGCNGDGKSSSEAAATAAATATATGSPVAPTPSDGASAGASAGAPTAGASGGPAASATAPAPAGTAPGSVPPAPAQPTGVTPPGPGIAVGEPNPNGPSPAVRPAVTYRVDGSNKLTVYFYGGVCQQYALKADESHPGQVDVKVVVAAPVKSGQVCSELAKRQTVTADLRAPLAGRTVNDLSTGNAIPLDADPHAGPDPVSPDGAAK